MNYRLYLAFLAVSPLMVSGCVLNPNGIANSDTVLRASDGDMPIYSSLSNITQNSNLGGVGIRADSQSERGQLVESSGTISATTGATTLTDGNYTLRDNDGPDADGIITDGNAAMFIAAVPGYDYVTVYSKAYRRGSTDYVTAGAGGIITHSVDVPGSGSATYLGRGGIIVATDDYGYDTDATSRVTANFSSGSVDVEMKATDARAPVDNISVTGMHISGNRFSGGYVSHTKNGRAVTLTGTNTGALAKGAFFGYDPVNSVPDEVGGAVLIQGNSGVVSGIFIAD